MCVHGIKATLVNGEEASDEELMPLLQAGKRRSWGNGWSRRWGAVGMLIAFIQLVFVFPASAQQVEGEVIDAQTKTTLPSAHVWVKNTTRGTITNAQGKFTLSLDHWPDTIMVRHLGYHTRQQVVRAASDHPLTISLKPARLEMEEVVVTPLTGEDIMRKVITYKMLMRRKLANYKATAYSRQTLANDTAIVSINESVSRIFWKKGKGHREVILSEHKTKNIASMDFAAGVRYVPNFYDDEIEIAGYRAVGPTHPDATKYYDFEVVEQRRIDEKAVYVIKLHPRRRLVPAFTGRVFVLDDPFALLKVELEPNDVVNMPRPIRGFDLSYRQQFNEFEEQVWLPVDMRIEGGVKLKMIGLELPWIHFKHVSRITDYELNTSLPDSLYQSDNKWVYDTTRYASDSLWTQKIEPIPLTDEEERAYASIDSTYTLEKAFKPEGALARWAMEDDEENDSREGEGFLNGVELDKVGFEPRIRFNRVDALYLGGHLRRSPFDHWQYTVAGGYSWGTEQAGYRAALRYQRAGWEFKANYHAETDTRYDSDIYGMMFASVLPLTGYPDYFDYFRDEGFRGVIGFDLPNTTWKVGMDYINEAHRSLVGITSYDLLGRNNRQRINPTINEGRLAATEAYIEYGNFGESDFGFSTENRLRLSTTIASEPLGGDFNYTRFDLDATWSFPTFLQRRLQPNRLTWYVDAGTFAGSVPVQSHGVVDASFGVLNPNGTLRSISFRPYEGRQYVSVIAEHNFQTVPFELLGLRGLAERDWGLILFGGAARTWMDPSLSSNADMFRTTDGWHTEVGVSINRFLGWFRLDVVRRLDEPSWQVGIGVGQIF